MKTEFNITRLLSVSETQLLTIMGFLRENGELSQDGIDFINFLTFKEVKDEVIKEARALFEAKKEFSLLNIVENVVSGKKTKDVDNEE